MAYPAYIKKKARELRRKKKLTIDELAERLAISRTTIYYWVRDIPIPRTGPGGGFSREAIRKAALANSRRFRQLREAAYDQGIETYCWFHNEPSFRDFVCLYICEGYKRGRNCVAVGNSDPAVLVICKRWMTLFSARDLQYNVQYHADQDVEEIRRFWGATLGIKSETIRLQRKSNSGGLAGRTWRSKHGVLTIRSSDTYFRAELQAWMDSIREEWVLDSRSNGA